MSTTTDKRTQFRRLHEQGCFVIPNPWDIGSARLLEQVGFQALASTSSGLAWSRGRADGELGRDAVLAHLRELAAATSLPLNADFESGFADDAAGVAESVRMAVATGIAGLSIEDARPDPGDGSGSIRPIAEAVERLRAARAAIDESDADVMLVGRAENFFHGRPDLADTIARLRAYAEAGADVLYAPGIRTREQIEAVVAAVAPKPVNLLIGSTSEFTLADVAAMGVRRISVGGGLARAAWGGFLRAAQGLAAGRFDGFEGAATGAQLNGALGAPPA